MIVGTFEVKSRKLWISDPCYSKNTNSNCSKVIENVSNGTWVGEIEISNEGVWGKRVSHLTAFKKYLKDSMHYPTDYFEVAVDSGQMGIFDFEAHPYKTGDYGDEESLYKKICNLTCGDNSAGVVEHGVASSSGFGDGRYEGQIYVDKEGLVVGVEIEFIGEEVENYEEENDYEEQDYEDVEDVEDD